MNSSRHHLAILAALIALNTSQAAGAPGDLDSLDVSVNDTANTIVVQLDGKTILAGSFTSVFGFFRTGMARLKADGTFDAAFAPQPDLAVNCVAVQADGKLLVGGNFTTIAFTTRPYLARLNADGSLDTGFNPRPNGAVNAIAVQDDGKILIGGLFTTLQPNGAATATVRQRIARVNSNGTLDPVFNPTANGGVQCLAIEPDGQVLLGGLFTTLQPNGAVTVTARQRIARVSSSGTLDMGFDPKANSTVNGVTVQADGKVLLTGGFTTLQPNHAPTATSRFSIARVDADGSLDLGFDPKANGTVDSVAIQADGKVLLGGSFTTLQPNGASSATSRLRIARLNLDGTLDTGFDPRANGFVHGMAVQADGMILIGGAFTSLQPNGAPAATPRDHFARLENNAATQTLSTPNTTQVFWSRNGAGPEIEQVTFELSADAGNNWSPLGTGIRAIGGWHLTGLALPTSGQIRARGRATSGYFSGDSALIEQMAAISYLTSLESWKLTHLGNAKASDTGDPDSDGLLTLAEYGLSLLPGIPNAAPQVDAFDYAGGRRLRMFVSRDPTHDEVTVEVQAAGSLEGPWTSVATSTHGAPYTGPGYVGGDSATAGVKTVEIRDTINVNASARRFMHVKVTH